MLHATERRSLPRPSVRFQPACIEADGRCHIALLRDTHRLGAGFESDLPLSCGQTIRYRWGNEDFVTGTVIWTGVGKFSVKADPGQLQAQRSTTFSYRSVRVPASLPVSVFADSRKLDGELINFAHRGACILLSQSIPDGTMATLKVGCNEIDASTFKWTDGIKRGIAFSRPLAIREMAAILDNARV